MPSPTVLHNMELFGYFFEAVEVNIADTQIIWEVLCQTCSWITPGPAWTLVSGSAFCTKCSLQYIPLQRIFQLCPMWNIMWHRMSAFWKSLINRDPWQLKLIGMGAAAALPTDPSHLLCFPLLRRRHQGSHLDGNQWYLFLGGLNQLSLWSGKHWSWLKGVCGDCGSLKPGPVQSLCA